MSAEHPLLFKQGKRILPWIGVLLFGILLYRSDLSAVYEEVRSATWGWILLSVVLGIPFCVLKSERWRLLLVEREVALSFGEAFRIFTLGLLAGLVTPGQLGELYKIVDIKKLGGSYKDGFMSSVGDRILDLLLIMAMAGFYFLLKLFPSVLLFTNVYFFSFTILIFSFVSTWLWLRIFKKKKKASLQLIFKVSSLTFGAYTIYVFRLLILFWALDLSLPLVFFTSAMGVMSIISLLPLSIMGVGLREVSLFQLLATTDITENQIISFSLFVVLLYLFNGIIGAVSWIWQYGRTKR
ncbi:MAG: flippase-like domain-containing protein [Bernardetiaceae bacterium]|nr:flippase-like domain-containing protein [Bernardetiaceae bacterium]